MGLFKSSDAAPDISQNVPSVGMEMSGPGKIAQPTSAYISKVPESGQLAILPALLGGGLAAAIGGGAWGLIVILTGYVIGYMAWGIGLLSGFAVVLFSRGQRGIPLQVIAVIASVMGIVVGKYTTFFHFVRKAVAKEHGDAIAANVSFMSEKTVQVFAQNIGSMLSGFDILWVLLAVVTAWRIPKAIGSAGSGHPG
jgi:hypothetical protein